MVKAYRRYRPMTLWAGVILIGFSELILFGVDLPGRRWLVVPLAAGEELPEAAGALALLGRWVAVNMTGLCWVGYLLLFDGVLTHLARKRGPLQISSIRARPNRFIFAWLSSIGVWCFFDWVNFYYMRAWMYHGLPTSTAARYVGYFIAFAAISPGMLLAAQWFNALGLKKLRTPGVRIPLSMQIVVCLLGVVLSFYPFIASSPIGTLTLWISLVFLLDPVNHWIGAPSIMGDWRSGRWGRTVSLMAGGALCGFCWEFWNYWALAKWTYDLPFLGTWQQYRYFEMPWLGFLGFLPFALECWVLLNTLCHCTDLLGLRVTEPLTDSDMIL